MRARAGRLGLVGVLFVGVFERSCISDLRPFVLRASARELELLRRVSIGSPFHALVPAAQKASVAGGSARYRFYRARGGSFVEDPSLVDCAKEIDELLV